MRFLNDWEPDGSKPQKRAETISLPLHPRLSDENVADVIGVIRDLISSYRR